MALTGKRFRPDILTGVGITLFAGLIRFLHLGRPAREIFDEQFYARDACWYVFRNAAKCQLLGEPPEVHPPLGKWLIAAGIKVFDFTPFGARIAPWVAGTIAVALVFVLARRLTGRIWPGVAAASFLAIDPLHVLNSRISQLDIFVVTFVLAALLFALMDAQKRDADPRRPVATPLLFACGLACGGAIATKWSAVPVWLMCIGLVWLWRRRPLVATPHRDPRALAAMGLALIVVPLVVYVASYVGRLDADSVSEWPSAFWQQQSYMATYLAEELPPHLYESQPWEWLIGQGPIVYDFEIHETGFEEVMAAGNPLLYPLATVGVVLAGVRAVRTRGRDRTAAIAATGFAVTFGPWLLASLAGRGHLFVYYLLASLPFMALGIAWLAAEWKGRERVLLPVLLVASCGLLLFLWPLLTAAPLSPQEWRTRHLIHSVCPKEGETVMISQDLVQLLNLACRAPRPTG